MNSIKLIPYGIANYGLIREENYYYVDKTPYLHTLKNAGRYLFFIRPRRFGKSLFLATMEGYYDVYYKDDYEQNYKDTWIYDHPLDDRHSYLVLSLNFSVVEPDPKKIETSFHNHIQVAAVDFTVRYSDILSVNPKRKYYEEKIEESRSASDILTTLMQLSQGAKQKLMVMIDEYDNFANTILATVGEEAYLELTHGPGFFRSFFNVLKKGTTGMGAPISRSIITGVSPFTMDDVTSGYNIGKNVSLDPDLDRMLGFTEEEVIDLIEYYRSKGKIYHSNQYLMKILTQWYGNYRFSEKGNGQLFNSDMILYFFDHYMSRKELPDELIDRNVRIDYGKLRHLIIIDKGNQKTSNGNFEQLRSIIKEGKISSTLVKGFPLEQLTSRENFVSLLFYFGLLTIEQGETGGQTLVIPNETIRRLYYDYIKEAYEETGVFDLSLFTYHNLMKKLALDGEWKPFFDYITGRMRESMSLRDLINGEKSIQAFLNVYLGLTNLYIIHVEKEMNKGYADIVMEPFLARYEGLKYSYILEIKYLAAGAKKGDPGVNQLISGAREQLGKYAEDKKFKKAIEKTTLIKLALIFSGHDLIEIIEC